MNEFEAVGVRITQLRGDMTKQSFALGLGVDRKTVERWEAGERLPDGSKLQKLATEFGADLNYILTGKRSNPTTDAAEQVLLDSYRRCSQQAKQNLIQTAALLSAGLYESQKAMPAPTINDVGRDNIQGNDNVQNGVKIAGNVEVNKGASQKFFGSVGNVAGRDINMQPRKRTKDKS